MLTCSYAARYTFFVFRLYSIEDDIFALEVPQLRYRPIPQLFTELPGGYFCSLGESEEGVGGYHGYSVSVSWGDLFHVMRYSLSRRMFPSPLSFSLPFARS
jgi:hypothetical protein